MDVLTGEIDPTWEGGPGKRWGGTVGEAHKQLVAYLRVRGVDDRTPVYVRVRGEDEARCMCSLGDLIDELKHGAEHHPERPFQVDDGGDYDYRKVRGMLVWERAMGPMGKVVVLEVGGGG
jgi:hypothetical protein